MFFFSLEKGLNISFESLKKEENMRYHMFTVQKQRFKYRGSNSALLVRMLKIITNELHRSQILIPDCDLDKSKMLTANQPHLQPCVRKEFALSDTSRNVN